MKISHNQISLAGEFAVLSQLALRGFDANLTLGNTKGVDILASHPDTGEMYRIEVKTNYRNSRNRPSRSNTWGYAVSGWMMNKKHETIVDDKLFYCFVNIAADTNIFKFYVIPSKVVAKYVKDSHTYWLKEKNTRNDSAMRVLRIGIKGEKYPIATPLAERYENNWEFKK